jgi:hypothetical protein
MKLTDIQEARYYRSPAIKLIRDAIENHQYTKPKEKLSWMELESKRHAMYVADEVTNFFGRDPDYESYSEEEGGPGQIWEWEANDHLIEVRFLDPEEFEQGLALVIYDATQ